MCWCLDNDKAIRIRTKFTFPCLTFTLWPDVLIIPYIHGQIAIHCLLHKKVSQLIPDKFRQFLLYICHP